MDEQRLVACWVIGADKADNAGNFSYPGNDIIASRACVLRGLRDIPGRFAR